MTNYDYDYDMKRMVTATTKYDDDDNDDDDDEDADDDDDLVVVVVLAVYYLFRLSLLIDLFTCLRFYIRSSSTDSKFTWQCSMTSTAYEQVSFNFS